MPRGRHPKPSTIAFLTGDPGRRRRYQVEPTPPSEPPVAPDYLDAVALEEWDQVTKQLHDMGLLTRIDRTSIICYCEAWSRYRQAAEHVKKYGSVILSPNKKFPMVSPYLTVMRHALKDVMSFADRFGLSPCARARLAIKDNGTEDDDYFSKLVG